MKVQLIQECESPNPAYSVEEELRARAKGEEYGVPRVLKRAVGEYIEHPQAVRLCVPQAMNRPPLAIPVDDAAKKVYREIMAARGEVIAELDLRLRQKPRSEAERLQREALRLAYADELNDLDPDRYPLPGGGEIDDEE